jgi:hypothetical protein
VVSPSGTSPDGFPNTGFCAWHDWNGTTAYTNMPYVLDAGSGRSRALPAHVARESLARDSTKIEESSQPSSVAALSHHCMKAPSRRLGSGYQVDR